MGLGDDTYFGRQPTRWFEWKNPARSVQLKAAALLEADFKGPFPSWKAAWHEAKNQ
jgi:hypothetical protein